MSDGAMPQRLCQCGCGEDPGIYKSTNRKHGIVKGQPKRFVLGHHVVPKYTGCSVDECNRPHAANGYCHLHNERLQRHGTTNGPKRYVRPSDTSANNLCECGCGQPVGFRAVGAKGAIARRPKRFIHGHSARQPREKKWAGPCAVDGCDRPASRRGWCGAHYQRWYKHGSPGTAALLRQTAPAGYKICSCCHETKPIDDFYLKSEGRPMSQCRGCTSRRNEERYSQNREQRSAWQTEYRRVNADKVREADRDRSRAAYADAIATGRCAYKQGRGCIEPSHPDSVLCDAHRERSRQLSWDKYHGTFIDSYSERGLVSCWLCLGPFTIDNPVQHDHLIPWSHGGPDEPWNMAPAHGFCNNSRGNRSLADTSSRWHPSGPPAAVAEAVEYALSRMDECKPRASRRRLA